MKRAILTSGTHRPACSGCPVCSDDMARVLTMGNVEYSAWLTQRTAAMRNNAAAPQMRIATETPKPPTVAAKLQQIAERYKASTPPALARSLTDVARDKVRAAMNAT